MKCILLAGGSGERLWPLSRELYPKFLLNFYGDDSLIQNTYKTALKTVPDKNILTVTNIRLANDIKMQLNKLSKNPAIITEPVARNTAAAVLAGLTYIEMNGAEEDDTVLILPVDFRIDNEAAFKDAINRGKKIAKKDYLAVIGIKPEYDEPDFGYIIPGKSIRPEGKEIKKFKEKPSIDEIKEFGKAGTVLWNSGIYISKISVLKEAYKKHAPKLYSTFGKEIFDGNNIIDYKIYENLPNISFDKAITEKADNTAVTEADMSWHDYGSWRAIYNNGEKDSKGNVVTGNVITDNVKNSFIYSSKKLVAASGITDTVIVETEDAVLVCDKSKATEISKTVKELKSQNESSTILRKTVFRPWGFYTCLNEGEGWLTKIITVAPGHKLSLQSHNHRSEHWVVLEGIATVLLDNTENILQKRQSIDIPVKAKHSLQNLTDKPLKILEVQKGNYISEDDIIRYEDIYGRVAVRS